MQMTVQFTRVDTETRSWSQVKTVEALCDYRETQVGRVSVYVHEDKDKRVTYQSHISQANKQRHESHSHIRYPKTIRPFENFKRTPFLRETI